MLIHYEGYLGTFDYDDQEFEIKHNVEFASEDGGSRLYRECLVYIGTETDGERIHIPDGIRKITGMFYKNDNIKTAPEIPESVRIADYAFAFCENLESIVLFDMESCDYICQSCTNLRDITIRNYKSHIDLQFLAVDPFKDCRSDKHVTIEEGYAEIKLNNISNIKRIDISSENLKWLRLSPDTQEIYINGEDVSRLLYFFSHPVSSKYVLSELDLDKADYFYLMNENKEASETFSYLDWGTVLGIMFGDPDIRRMMTPFLVDFMNAAPTLHDKIKNIFKKEYGRSPKCINPLASAAAILYPDMSLEEFVKKFDIKFTAEAIKKMYPIIPATICRCFLPKDMCVSIIENDLDGLVMYACNIDRNVPFSNLDNIINFIAKHKNSNINTLKDIITLCHDKIDKNSSIKSLSREVRIKQGEQEIKEIEEKYNISLSEQRCNIPLTKTIYGQNTARVLDFNDEYDRKLMTILGQLTDCCQHLGEAGETSMMHGILHPDAGFWVIENKDGEVLAQAEIWLENKDTLVFDNIEFANTPNENRSKRIKQLGKEIAKWASEAPYENIIMGCGYNEIDYSAMKKALTPELRVTPEEYRLLNRLPYSDVGRSVYIKHDGVVSEYLINGKEERDEKEETVMEEEESLFF